MGPCAQAPCIVYRIKHMKFLTQHGLSIKLQRMCCKLQRDSKDYIHVCSEHNNRTTNYVLQVKWNNNKFKVMLFCWVRYSSFVKVIEHWEAGSQTRGPWLCEHTADILKHPHGLLRKEACALCTHDTLVFTPSEHQLKHTFRKTLL